MLNVLLVLLISNVVIETICQQQRQRAELHGITFLYKIIFKFRKFFCLKGTQIMAKNNFPGKKHVRLIFFHVRRKKNNKSGQNKILNCLH